VARPKAQTEQRKNLVQAAMDAVASRGLSGLRLKDIAEHAGLSIGSVSYYYPELNDLLVEAHHEAMERFYWNRVERVALCNSAIEAIQVAVREGIPEEPVTSDVYMLYELHTYAGRSSAHADLMTDLWEKEVSVYQGIIERGIASQEFLTVQSPRTIAETAVALEDAFNLHLVSSNSGVSSELGRDRLLAYLTGVLGFVL